MVLGYGWCFGMGEKTFDKRICLQYDSDNGTMLAKHTGNEVTSDTPQG